MSEPYLGEIRMFGGTFAPQGWLLCHGQLLMISQNDALFSLLGTTYGGDGRTTFGIPDLRSRVPIHYGSGPGLTPRNLGAKPGAENVFISTAELPSHSHTLNASSENATSTTASGNTLAQGTTAQAFNAGSTPTDAFGGDSISLTGGGQNHYNIQPYLPINFIIATVGVYPSRN